LSTLCQRIGLHLAQEARGERRAGLFGHPRQHVRVDRQCDRRRRVTEHLADHLDRHPARQHQRSSRMPVQRLPRWSGSFGRPARSKASSPSAGAPNTTFWAFAVSYPGGRGSGGLTATTKSSPVDRPLRRRRVLRAGPMLADGPDGRGGCS